MKRSFLDSIREAIAISTPAPMRGFLSSQFGFTVEVADCDNKVNVWENPPEASERLKAAVEPFKNKFNPNDPWDGDFVL